MLDKRLEDAINAQINAEIYSAYLYASMAAFFDATSLPGFSHWMRVQVQEELGHVTRFYDFVHNRGRRVRLAAVDAPPSDWDSPLAVFELVVEHEKTVSEKINALMDLVVELGDHMAKELLHWYVAEQVEEEATAEKMVNDLQRVGGDGTGLLMLDREAAARSHVAPAG